MYSIQTVIKFILFEILQFHTDDRLDWGLKYIFISCLSIFIIFFLYSGALFDIIIQTQEHISS